MAKRKKSKILIVDNDPMNILILEDILGDEYQLKTIPLSETSQAEAINFQPDLILLDILSNESNAYDFCKQLREDDTLKFVKIILVSSKTLLKDRLKGYSVGADDHIAKPFDKGELLAKIRIFIRLKSVEEIDRVKDDLLNLFSHETRTPLNAIIGFSKLLMESKSISKEEQEFIELIQESGLSLLNLSNKAILLSTLKNENYVLDALDTPLSLILENTLEKTPPAKEKKNITIYNSIDYTPTLHVDANLIVTALTFIIDNAVKYSEPNSTVTLSHTLDNTYLSIHVKDEGCGVPVERLDSLFSEFGVKDIEHHGRGHALSLAIVNYIMELHEGVVTVKNNTPEPGATFTLSFPISVIQSELEPTSK